MSESTEIDRTPVTLGGPVTNLDSAVRLSKALAMASIMPQRLFGRAPDVLAVMLYGQDLGLSPMQSIQGIYVVKGKPQLSSQTWTALARRAGHKLRQIESTAERCTIEIITKDDPDHPHRETYTISDAVQAGLVEIKDGKPFARSSKGEPLPWETNTRTMLRNRAISNGAKMACPEVAMGFAIEGDYDYIPDDTVVEVVPPETATDQVVVEPEKLVSELAALTGQFDFAPEPETAEVIQPEPAEDYECVCGAVGDHFEDDCPKAGEADV